MTVIRDDDNERLARVERVIETIKKRQDDIEAVVQESAEVIEEAARTRDGARTISAQLGQRRKGPDET